MTFVLSVASYFDSVKAELPCNGLEISGYRVGGVEMTDAVPTDITKQEFGSVYVLTSTMTG